MWVATDLRMCVCILLMVGSRYVYGEWRCLLLLVTACGVTDLRVCVCVCILLMVGSRYMYGEWRCFPYVAMAL